MTLGRWAAGLILALALSACSGAKTGVPLPQLDAAIPISPGQEGPYRVQAGDLLRVKFVYHPEFDVKVPVRPDGAISLQAAGDLHVSGKTTEEIEKLVVQRTSDRLRDPVVSVLVAQTTERRVYVMGEVRVPGIVPFHDGMTPLQAIADRGGFAETARIDSVLRLSPGERDYVGTRLDFTRPLQTGAPEGVELHAGDVLFIPRNFIGDVNAFVQLYIRGIMPIQPRIGAATTF